MNTENDKSVNPDDLPENAFQQKEHFQHPQPTDWGKAIDTKNNNNKKAGIKEQDKTSKVEGLNEERSAGTGGAFEGFENQGDS